MCIVYIAAIQHWSITQQLYSIGLLHSSYTALVYYTAAIQHWSITQQLYSIGLLHSSYTALVYYTAAIQHWFITQQLYSIGLLHSSYITCILSSVYHSSNSVFESQFFSVCVCISKWTSVSYTHLRAHETG